MAPPAPPCCLQEALSVVWVQRPRRGVALGQRSQGLGPGRESSLDPGPAWHWPEAAGLGTVPAEPPQLAALFQSGLTETLEELRVDVEAPGRALPITAWDFLVAAGRPCSILV